MTMLHMLAGGLAASVALSSVHADKGGSSSGSKGGVIESSVSCKIKASAYNEVDNKQATAVAVEEATQYICGDGDVKNDQAVNAYAHDTATAMASAVAHASIDCTIKGTGGVDISVYARAENEAKVWLNAYAEAFAEASVCGKCDAVAVSYAEVIEEVTLKAIADVYLSVSEHNDDPNAEITIDEEETKDEIVTATVTAYAEAIADAKSTAHSTECFAGTAVEVVGEESGAACISTTLMFDDNSYNNAVAMASVEAETGACKGFSQIDAELVAEEVATATARAFGSIWSGCVSVGDAYGCVENDGWIETTSKAVATAIVEVMADTEKCDCQFDVDLFLKSLGGAIATAATDAWASQCTKFGSDGDLFYIDEFEKDMMSLSVKAVAQIFIDATSGTDGCSVDVTGDASVCQCLENNAKCAEEEDRVVGCCTKGFACIQRGRGAARCRRDRGSSFDTVLPETCGSH